jgi:hypothetical protein
MYRALFIEKRAGAAPKRPPFPQILTQTPSRKKGMCARVVQYLYIECPDYSVGKYVSVFGTGAP